MSRDLEQRYVIKFLRTKGLKLPAIVQELSNTYGADAYPETDVKYWIHELKLGREDLHDQGGPGRPPLDDVDAKILALLQKEPYSSVRTLSESLRYPPTTVYRHLTDALQMKSRHFKWVPHLLTQELREKRSAECRALLDILKLQRENDFRDIVTGDESWIFLDSKPKSVWLASDAALPVRVSQTIGAEKRMLIVFWGVQGIVYKAWLPKNESITASFFCDDVLPHLAEMFATKGENRRQFTYVHMDNARPHTAKATLEKMKVLKLKRTPQPPYSPDVAPTDFFLFGWLKGKLETRTFASEDDLFEAVDEILATLSADQIRRVFNTWISRLELVIQSMGHYIP